MIAMIDDSKLDDRANGLKSIGFHMAQLGKPPSAPISFTSFAVRRSPYGCSPPGYPNCRIPVDLHQLVPRCKSHSNNRKIPTIVSSPLN